MKRVADITGQKFGRWTVTAFDYKNKYSIRYWACQCDCGNRKSVQESGLTSGKSKSCGCLKNEVTTERIVKQSTTHGMHGTPTYKSWQGIIFRCSNLKANNYHRYGGRGIKVCERWLKFENFLHDMGKIPKGRSIDRINNDGNYEPVNCRWATRKEQARNMSNNRLITHQGETKTLIEWSELVGLRHGTLAARLDKGWPIEKALTQPLRGGN